MELKNMQNPNPLSKHFRQPAVFLKLPSGGKYWAANSLNLSANGEIGIMPMTAKDEIMLRTPDALMNGQGVVSVIQSCVPAITNAWAMPTIDVDAVLIAIRIATYGETLEMDSKCPKCDHESRHGLDLNSILLRVKAPNYIETLQVDGLTFKFKPLNYIQSTKNNVAAFEEQQIMQLITNENIDPETRKAQFDVHIQKIISSNLTILSGATESITTEDGTIVTNYEHISQFYDNTNNNIIKTVQAHLKKLADQAALPATKVQCESCENEYEVNVTFDYSNFFEPLS
jgi:T4 bacteriophage base plate protein